MEPVGYTEDRHLPVQPDAHQPAFWARALTWALDRLAAAADPLLPWFAQDWARSRASVHGPGWQMLNMQQVQP